MNKAILIIALILGLAFPSGATNSAHTWPNGYGYTPSQTTEGTINWLGTNQSQGRIDAKLGRILVVGDPSYPTFAAAVATLNSAGTACTLRLPVGTHTVAADLTINSNINLTPDNGALITIATGKTLTNSGSFNAGLYQVFSCTGTGKVAFAAGAVPTIYPQWWGASPSASAAVNTAAIQASLNSLINNTSWTLPPGAYTCNDSVILGSYSTTLTGLDMVFKGQLLFDTCSGLDIRGIRYSNIRGIDVKRTAKDWSANHFGVKFGKCRRCNVELKYVQNFTYGYYLDGDGNAGDVNSYMTFDLGYIADNQYGEYVTSVNGGWVNEISYYGGQFTQNSILSFAPAAVNTTADTITVTNSLATATPVYLYPLMGYFLPNPLVIGTTYYAIHVDNSTIKLATSAANANAGTAIDLSTQGTGPTLNLGLAGSWGVYFAFTSGNNRFDNHRWYNPDFEGLHNGVYFAGYAGSSQMLLSHPRFEAVANWIEAAPRNLTWIQGAGPISRSDMPIWMPRLNDPTGKSVVTILGSGYYDIDSYCAYATPKENGITWYNMWDLRQVTNLINTVQTYFCTRIDNVIAEVWPGAGGQTTSQYLNKAFEAAAAPTGAHSPMTYAKGAVVWNTTVASGQPMGWVCSVSGSVYRSGTIYGTGTISGATLTVTTVGNTQYLFPGAYIKVGGSSEVAQIKAVVSYDTTTNLGVYTLYAAPVAQGAGLAIADCQPTWVAMANYP